LMMISRYIRFLVGVALIFGAFTRLGMGTPAQIVALIVINACIVIMSLSGGKKHDA